MPNDVVLDRLNSLAEYQDVSAELAALAAPKPAPKKKSKKKAK